MSASKVVEPGFQGAGQKLGTEIWRIENFQPVPLPLSDYGKFYSGDSYIVLQTTSGKGGAYLFDIHFWIGKDTSQDEAGTAAIKSVELDAVLGGRAVQHREIQDYESDKFLSYFKPSIIPLESGVASGFKKPEEEDFEIRLYVCKGKRAVKLKQVPFARSSLNHDDVFILDTKSKIYQFNGKNSNIQERAKALEVVQLFKEKYHDGTCDVAIVDDGKLMIESDSGDFWGVFGGFAPIGKKIASEDDIFPEWTPAKLFCIVDGEVEMVEGSLSKSFLEKNKCYLLDCGAEVFVWVGRGTQLDERIRASEAAEEFITSQNRPKATRLTRVIQGYEPHSFKTKFDSWPLGSANSTPEEGMGKVAALLKQRGAGIKSTVKNVPVVEEVPPLLEGDGKTEVWRIDESAKTPIPGEEIGKFYSGDCYIVLYTYRAEGEREEFYLCYWIGRDSSEDDQQMALRLSNTMFKSLKGRSVQGRIYQGQEPPQFIAIFQPMVILKGGLSTGFKKYISEKGLEDETYTSDSVALIRISGTSVHNNKATQVDAVAASLNTNDCFILQSGSSVFIWLGNESSRKQNQLAVKVANFLKPGVALKHAKEGTESSNFWNPLGGKQSYNSENVVSEIVRDSHLFTYSFNKGKFQVQEVYNFTQDDLLTEDLMILDTHVEVFVWVGYLANAKEKQSAFEIGQNYINMASSPDGLSAQVPLYRTTEGNEPCLFTTYFSWDYSKPAVQGNSFQKKFSLLFGTGQVAESPDKSYGSNQGGATQRASALAALSSAFNPASTDKRSTSPRVSASSQGSQKAAALAALSRTLSTENNKVPTSLPAPRRYNKSTSDTGIARAMSEELNEVALKVEPEEGIENNESTFTYEQLRIKSENPATGIDFKRREAYLSNEEFHAVFNMTKQAFWKQPRWKQELMKKKVDLF